MKKWIAGLLSLSLLLMSTACGVNTPPTVSTGTVTVQRPTVLSTESTFTTENTVIDITASSVDSLTSTTKSDNPTVESIVTIQSTTAKESTTTATTTTKTTTTTGMTIIVSTSFSTTESTAVGTTTTSQVTALASTTTSPPETTAGSEDFSKTTTSFPITTTSTITGSTTVLPNLPSTQEMRAAWVSYIEINEMLQSCSTVQEIKQAIDELMKRLAKCNLNTVFFHIRANSDAYYPSEYFRPAYAIHSFLQEDFDFLAYAVEAAHKQKLKIHAWINPYRIGTDKEYAVEGVPTFSKTLNGVTRYYYVPTSSATQKLVLDGVREVLSRYAVDGIQYDDYFYPENTMQTSTAHDFESADYTAYLQSGGSLSVANWRRAAVDSLVSSTYIAVKNTGRIFGISPAANAEQTYSDLYADCLKWLSQSGYVDYLCPQLYTGFEHQSSPFNEIVDKWLAYPRHPSVKLYVGIATYKAGLKKDAYAGTGKTEWANNTDILKRQVLYLRSKNISGIALYSYSYLFPAEKAGLTADNILSVAEKEVENLLSVL